MHYLPIDVGWVYADEQQIEFLKLPDNHFYLQVQVICGFLYLHTGEILSINTTGQLNDKMKK